MKGISEFNLDKYNKNNNKDNNIDKDIDIDDFKIKRNK